LKPICDVSVVLSTYNRAGLLGPALERLLDQRSDAPPYELVVVDNNSTDETRTAIEARMVDAPGRLRYVFEPKQGLSHARNAGIAAAQADVVAFTDDDVRVARDWVLAIARAFAARPDVECVGGRTLPVWPSPPPVWLSRLHWVGPLALQDYGDDPLLVDARKPICLAGANFAFRKQVFARIGMFSADFPRSEDTELLIRLWLAGGRALYVPDMIAHAAVQPERLTKTYHRHWHANIGHCNARMRFEELGDPVMGLRASVPALPRLFGAPAFAYRQLAREAWRWLTRTLARREDEAFFHELRGRALVGYIRESRSMARGGCPEVPVHRIDKRSAAVAGRMET
jgi:glucosyl-dolichyl phosphate glucuronosyltransferase